MSGTLLQRHPRPSTIPTEQLKEKILLTPHTGSDSFHPPLMVKVRIGGLVVKGNNSYPLAIPMAAQAQRHIGAATAQRVSLGGLLFVWEEGDGLRSAC